LDWGRTGGKKGAKQEKKLEKKEFTIDCNPAGESVVIYITTEGKQNIRMRA